MLVSVVSTTVPVVVVFPVIKCWFTIISFVMVWALEYAKLFSKNLHFNSRVPKYFLCIVLLKLVRDHVDMVV